MLTLLLGRDWTANRKKILQWIAQDVQKEKPGRILLVPELISHDTERRLAAAAGDTASRFAEVLSFSRLSRRVSDLAGYGAQECLDNGGRVVAMAAATKQLTGQLKCYANMLTRPEFLSMLVDIVDEFKRCGISPEDLKAAADPEALGSEFVQKLEELALLMGTYDALCMQGKRDPRDQMTWVLDQLHSKKFADYHVLYVDGFPDFTRQHMEILQYFIKASPDVTISLNCDRIDSTDPAFEKAAETARALLKFAKQAGVDVDILTVEDENMPLTGVRNGLFRGELQPAGEELAVYWAESTYKECQAVAEQILELTQQGARYRDMSIVCADMPGYRNVLQLVFQKYGIHLYLSGTDDILQHGVMATVLLALDAALGGLEQSDVLRYLRSVMSPLESDICDQLENHVIIWGISGKGWLQTWDQHPDGLRGQWDDRAYARLEQLNRARELAIIPLVRLRDSFREAHTLSQQVDGLYRFLEDVEFAQRLDAYAKVLQQQGDHREAQIMNQLWEILLNGLGQLNDVLGHTVWEDEAFSRLLKLLLSQYDVGTIPTVLDAVTAGSVSAMRCQQAQYLFVMGASEGNLPSYGGSAGILTAQERMELRNHNLPIADGAMDGLQIEFSEIYGVFCGAEKKITVSCTGSQPSFIYRRLAQMTGSEPQSYPCIGNALVNRNAAGAWLVKNGDYQTAETMGLSGAYLDTVSRSRFALGSMQPDTVRALYGNRLTLSASQVDSHAECRLSYFLKYGLRAKERKEATVDPAEFGSYVHAVLERTVRDVMAAGGFHRVSLEQTLEIALAHSKTYTDEMFNQIASQRMEYLFRRNVQELEMVVRELWRELNAAEYSPHRFELYFAQDGEMPAISIPGGALEAQLRGYVDRVDHWKQGETTYFRVVDYKTGKKDFDYCDVFNGVGLQMLLYMFALEDGGDRVLGNKRISAGVQYFPARAPFVTTDGMLTQEEAEAERLKMWKRKGLLLDDEASLQAMDPSEKLDILCCSRKKDGTISGDLADRGQLGMLKSYLMGLLTHFVDEIASGTIAPNPYTRGTSHDACTFCPYGGICHKETVAGRRNYKSMTAQRFWEEVEKEVDGHGG